MTDSNLIRYSGLKLLGIPWSRQHVGRLERAGQFPRRLKLGAKTACWRVSEVEAWIQARAADRPQTQA